MLSIELGRYSNVLNVVSLKYINLKENILCNKKIYILSAAIIFRHLIICSNIVLTIYSTIEIIITDYITKSISVSVLCVFKIALKI